jgi:hypothetical protein
MVDRGMVFKKDQSSIRYLVPDEFWPTLVPLLKELIEKYVRDESE